MIDSSLFLELRKGVQRKALIIRQREMWTDNNHENLRTDIAVWNRQKPILVKAPGAYEVLRF